MSFDLARRRPVLRAVPLLATLALVAACGPVPPGDTGAPTSEAPTTEFQTPEAPPGVAVTAPAGFLQPLQGDGCAELRDGVAEALAVDVTLTATSSFTDPLQGVTGSGCEVRATGTGADFTSPAEVLVALRGVLEAKGWAEDPLYQADGPTGTASGFKKEAAVCVASASWEPSDDANCPPDQPISACPLTPEQQLYTVTLSCATR